MNKPYIYIMASIALILPINISFTAQTGSKAVTKSVDCYCLNTLDEVVFKPDSTVNKKLCLSDPGSLEKFYPVTKDLSLHLNQDTYAFNLFCNSSHTEYLKTYLYEGAFKNEFSFFEIGYLKDEAFLRKTDKKYDTDYTAFETESKLALGMDFSEVLNIKGSGYSIQESKHDSIITYRIEAGDDSGFCERYNMPGYSLSLNIKNGKVNKIRYGFDYP